MENDLFETVGVRCPCCGYMVSIEGGAADKCPNCDAKLKINAVEEENQIGFPENPIIEASDPNQFVFQF